MSSRTGFRLIQLGAILLRAPRLIFKRRQQPQSPKRILVIHQLLLGDALMATGLLAHLRDKYPDAEIDVAGPPFLAGLYQSKPYNVSFIGFTPKNWRSFFSIWKQPNYDLALPVLDNRFSWTAFAIGARWIKGFANTKTNYKDIPFNELIPIPNQATSITDMMSLLSGSHSTLTFDPSQWPAPQHKTFELPSKPYVVLHLGASTPLKFWPSENWLRLAKGMEKLGFTPVWSAGPNELALVQAADPCGKFHSFGGKLDLAQLWHLIENATLLVSPDTGITHIAKHTATPTIALFGPGSELLAGRGEFFHDSPYHTLATNIVCRNHHNFFKRDVTWVQHCKHNINTCPHNAECIKSLPFDRVYQECCKLLGIPKS
ncbi:hypothetical protein A3K86_08710 [Photobacterium jeanii]|uniref:Glycosyl transferase n=1 Tax=Photobacterium jeanii TaxID=858640 RepID=A0A178KJ16_9GAMM|nr:glycosyltransferase family 9 protein [Photobacterium jeanii]OAN17005.1 hypothetical protein A3K86_08710 [Photobacterium jeanii]PST88295.1 glycosyltransferase family 9 protein [Photobacterium jeanii]